MSSLSDEDLRACAVCARILETVQGPDGEIKGHAHLYKPEEYDHIAVPVEIDEIEVRGRCDFGGEELDPRTAWILPVGDFEVAPGHMNRGDYAVCPGCLSAFHIHRPQAMVARLMRINGAPKAVLKPYIDKVYLHVLGEPYPMREAR